MPRVAQLTADPRETAAPRIRARRKSKPRVQYFAFLSYSHQDEELAKWLQRKLEQFQVPASLVGRLTPNGAIPRRLTPIFRDEHELAAADDLGEEIEAALDSSQCLVVLCSPKAAVSKWVNAEIATFKRVRPDGALLAAIASGEPFASELPGREHEECFPPALRHRFDRRGRPTATRAEPLAADLRFDGEARRAGLLKLIAGMLGISLDELVQREATQRHRRLAWTTAASLSGMVLATGLAVAAVQARDEARDQRREAEGLVAFMLGDLKDKLEPIGRLDALDGVGSRVLAYYSKQDAGELSDAALMQRSQALSLTAQVALLRGDTNTAQQLYRQAMEGTAEALRREPEDTQRMFDHAQNVFWSGELDLRRGDVSGAERAFREYGRLANAMIAAEPDNLKWRMEVQYARENLGIVLMSQRRFSEASRQFESALGPMEAAAAVDRDNMSYQLEVSNLMAWLADAQRALGRINAAVAIRERQVSFLERLLARGPNNVALRQQLVPAHRAVGLLWLSRGELDRGNQHLRMAIAEAERLIAIEPDNSFWKGLAAPVRLDLARSLIALQKIEEASREAAAGCGAEAALRARDSSVARWRRLQTSCLETRSRLALAAADFAQARTLAERALASARSERSGDPIEDRYVIAAAQRLLGDALQRGGDEQGAQGAWSAALAQLPANVNERPWELNERAELLRRVGRMQQAQPLLARLKSIGYHNVS